MKRVKSACILQTLVFMQKEDCGLSKNSILEANRRDFEHYKQTMDRTHTRYQIVSCDEQEDGSLIVRVRKQYNDRADVSEYFKQSSINATDRNWKNPIPGISVPRNYKNTAGFLYPAAFSFSIFVTISRNAAGRARLPAGQVSTQRMQLMHKS